MANPRIAEVCANLSYFYSLWNSFAFAEALKLSSSLFEQTLRFHDQISTRFHFDLNRLNNQVETVKKLAQQDRISILWNFYFGAERYEKNGQHDIAILLYYRTLESIFENALRDIADRFDRSNPDYSLFDITIEKLQDSFFEFRQKVFKGTSSQKNLPAPVAMFDAFCLLGALNNPLSQRIHPARVAHIAEKRNYSVYVHGLRPMVEEDINDMRKLTSDALQAYIEINKLEPIDAQRTKFEFMKLTAREE